MRDLATVKTAISLQDDVHRDGISKAKRLFGGNFSAYIGYLISRDREEAPQNKEKKYTAAIDQILDI